MRAADTYTESLFSLKKLDDFVPVNHPLRAMRVMAGDALSQLEELFASMYEDTSKGGRPAIAPQKLLRAMLLQVLYSVRSERLLMEQVQYNLLFRWFIGLSMDDKVWVPTVFTKNRQRLIEHGAVLAFFEQVLAQAEQRNWLSKEHFSVDGTLIQAWASHKSFVPKDGGDSDAGDGSNFRGSTRSNDSHICRTDPDSRLYRKGNTASQLCFMGHTLMENRNGLIVDAVLTRADGKAEREAAKAMIGKVVQARAQANVDIRISLGADRSYDAREFIEHLQGLNVQPHVAQNTSRRRSAVPESVAQSEGYCLSLQCRKRIEQGFGWCKSIGQIRQAMVRGLKKVEQMFVLNMAAYNLVRMRSLAQVRLQGAQ
ncbi:IS5 family transposase [Vandammella animalimorsus]|uniref:IS5 family transposase n=1 Tax=Vandammella animalimorsus TaxID=2029117 RepID=UPI0031BA8C8E